MAIIEKTEKTRYPGIYKLTYPSGKVSYRAHVFHPGKKPIAKMFCTLQLAERWKRLNKDSFEASGMPLTNRLLEKTKVVEIVDRYVEGGVNVDGQLLSKGTLDYIKRFAKWLKENGNPSLHAFNEQMAELFKDELLNGSHLGKGWKGKPRKVSPPSVRKHISVVQPIWKMARVKWGFANLDNPFRFIVIPGSDVVSTRRLKSGELSKLMMEATKSMSYGHHRYYIPIALLTAVETGMRREEIFSLTWKDVDIDNRRIRLEKTKTGIPRLIVMPFKTAFFLLQLKLQLVDAHLNGISISAGPGYHDDVVKYQFNESDRILYPHSQATKKYTVIERAIENFEETLWDVRQRAGLYDPDPDTKKDRWTFRCLRKEAAAQLRKCLRIDQVDRMMGHVDKRKNMTDRYWDLDDEDLRDIQDRLDRHEGGMTEAEIKEQITDNPLLTKEQKNKLSPIAEKLAKGEGKLVHHILGAHLNEFMTEKQEKEYRASMDEGWLRLASLVFPANEDKR